MKFLNVFHMHSVGGTTHSLNTFQGYFVHGTTTLEQISQDSEDTASIC